MSLYPSPIFEKSGPVADHTAPVAGTVYTTAGIHPCSSSVFGTAHPHAEDEKVVDGNGSGHTPPCDPDPSQPLAEDVEPDAAKTRTLISALEELIASARAASSSSSTKPPIVALGEMGLDYDRLHYSPASLQRHAFEAQLELAARLDPPLPLFLHSRAAHADFVSLLRRHLGLRLERLRGRAAVVHSFTGDARELRELLQLGLYVGVNGCSLKTAENCAVVRELLAWEGEGEGEERVKLKGIRQFMLETDGPWCEIRPTHEGWKYLVEVTKAVQGPAETTETDAATSTPASASEPPSGTSTPASIPIRGPPTPAPTTSTSTSTATPNPAADPTAQQVPGQGVGSQQQQPKPKKPQQQQSSKKQRPPPKKEPEVPERFRTVKKEKWAEGAMVKGRNEPCTIERVARAVAGIRASGSSTDLRAVEEEICEAAWRNTVAVFDVLDD